jgi:biotin synthase
MSAHEDGAIRHDWRTDEIVALHDLPLLELVGRANAVNRRITARST